MSTRLYNIKDLQDSMVKILDPKDGGVIGSGFIIGVIRHDGYLVTCHHVIYTLDRLEVEYQGRRYEAQWCQELSAPDQDVAVLRIDVEDARAVPIANPADLPMPVVLCGFTSSKVGQFSSGFDYHAREIRRSFPVGTLSTYSYRQEPELSNPWNVLPRENCAFSAYRVSERVDRSISGGPAFSEELSGAVGIVQSNRGGVSYVIRWDSIPEALVKLRVDPGHDAVCQFMEDMEERLNKARLFHCRQHEVILKDYYIPIQVTLERRYIHEVETYWGYAEAEVEARRAYALKGIYLDEHRPSQVPWEEARIEDRIMVLADPGMGKTTLLQMEAVSIAQREIQELSGKMKSLDDVVFPIFLKLSELNAQEWDVVEDILSIIGQRYPSISREIVPLLRRKLETGKCVLLLDALDEVPREDRVALSEKFKRFARSYKGQIICTSRIVGYDGAFLHNAREVEIVPFSRKQTEQYVRMWFANAAGSIQDDSVSANGFLQEVRSKPQLLGLAQNPLLLSLLCSLYQEKQIALPARRCQVYGQAVDCMLSKWAKVRRPGPEWDVKVTARLLEEMAYYFTCKGKETFSADEFHDAMEGYISSEEAQTSLGGLKSPDLLEELTEGYSILQKLERDGDRYIFLHRTFQKYFTASYLNRTKNRIDLVREHFWDFDWHETLILLAGLMDDPLPLLQAIMDKKDDIFSSMLLLAGRCMTECEDLSQPLMDYITNRVYVFWREHIDADFILSTIVNMGQAVPRMVEHLQEALKDTENLVRSSAAYALGEIGSDKAVDALIVALKDQDSYVRSSAASALGKIGSDKAVDALIVALKDYESYVGRIAAYALGEIGSDKALDALIVALEDQDSFVRSNAAYALDRNADPGVLGKLINSPRIRMYESRIFSLARRLAIRFSKRKSDFIPVYPGKIIPFPSSNVT